MVGKNFGNYCLQITGTCICKPKRMKADIFTHAPWQNFPPEKENTNILWIFISLKPFGFLGSKIYIGIRSFITSGL